MEMESIYTVSSIEPTHPLFIPKYDHTVDYISNDDPSIDSQNKQGSFENLSHSCAKKFYRDKSIDDS